MEQNRSVVSVWRQKISLINIQDYIHVDWEVNLKLFREKGQAR